MAVMDQKKKVKYPWLDSVGAEMPKNIAKILGKNATKTAIRELTPINFDVFISSKLISTPSTKS